MFDPRQHVRRLVLAALVLGLTCATPGYAQGTPAAAAQAYQELFSASQKDKKGLMFYVRGQQIAGVVTRVMGNDAVEVRNQTYGRIVIRLDAIDAVAMN
jgi:endonuclease YncB( thermonuclease family)